MQNGIKHYTAPSKDIFKNKPRARARGFLIGEIRLSNNSLLVVQLQCFFCGTQNSLNDAKH
jgi:hypothetical protein